MDPIVLMTRYPLLVLAVVIALYVVLHLTVLRGMRGKQPRTAAANRRPSRWVIRPGGGEGARVDLTAYAVTLDAPGSHAIAVLKVLRAETGLDLREAKEMLDAAPTRVKVCAGRDEAEAVAEALRREGASASVAQSGERRVGPRVPFEVLLEEAGDRPIDTIRLVRELSRRGLKESKELVEAAPQRVVTLDDREAAERCRERLAAEGAWVTLEA